MTQRKTRGFTLIEILISVAIIGILAAIAIPNILRSQLRAKYARAASETQQATTQSVVYSLDHNQYPGTLAVLRDSAYVNVPDDDSWGNAYVLSPPLAGAWVPSQGDDVHVFSKGPIGTGTFPSPFVNQTGPSGSVGYSSIYGGWSGS